MFGQHSNELTLVQVDLQVRSSFKCVLHLIHLLRKEMVTRYDWTSAIVTSIRCFQYWARPLSFPLMME